MKTAFYFFLFVIVVKVKASKRQLTFNFNISKQSSKQTKPPTTLNHRFHRVRKKPKTRIQPFSELLRASKREDNYGSTEVGFTGLIDSYFHPSSSFRSTSDISKDYPHTLPSLTHKYPSPEYSLYFPGTAATTASTYLGNDFPHIPHSYTETVHSPGYGGRPTTVFTGNDYPNVNIKSVGGYG